MKLGVGLALGAFTGVSARSLWTGENPSYAKDAMHDMPDEETGEEYLRSLEETVEETQEEEKGGDCLQFDETDLPARKIHVLEGEMVLQVSLSADETLWPSFFDGAQASKMSEGGLSDAFKKALTDHVLGSGLNPSLSHLDHFEVTCNRQFTIQANFGVKAYLTKEGLDAAVVDYAAWKAGGFAGIVDALDLDAVSAAIGKTVIGVEILSDNQYVYDVQAPDFFLRDYEELPIDDAAEGSYEVSGDECGDDELAYEMRPSESWCGRGNVLGGINFRISPCGAVHESFVSAEYNRKGCISGVTATSGFQIFAHNFAPWGNATVTIGGTEYGQDDIPNAIPAEGPYYGALQVGCPVTTTPAVPEDPDKSADCAGLTYTTPDVTVDAAHGLSAGGGAFLAVLSFFFVLIVRN